jgi:WD40 repeat protein
MYGHTSSVSSPRTGSSVLALAAIFVFSIFAIQADAQKLRLRAHLDPNCQVQSGLDSLKYSDLWADGNIAVQGSYNCRGAFIYDLSNPDAPVLASVYNPQPSQAFLEAIVVGNRGYFGSGGPWPYGAPNNGDGVHIVDLTDPYHPVLLGKVNSTHGAFNGVHEMNVYGNYLIENYNAVNDKTIKIIDVSNPQNPVLKWNMTPQDSFWVHAAHIRGNRMYLSGWGGRIEIYDLANLASAPPQLLGVIQGSSTNHSSWTSEDGNYLFSCRETENGDLRVYDVRNPAQPLLVKSISTIDLGLNAISPHNPIVKGNFLYISWYQAGVQVFDISDPISPRRVAQYDTHPQSFRPLDDAQRKLLETEPWDMVCGANLQALPTSYEGAWTAFPLLGADKVLVSDLRDGLFVLDARPLSSPSKNRVADFDGDRRTDISIFRPTSGEWELENSSTGQLEFPRFGLRGDIMAPGDYNGDGTTDIAVFRPSNGTWYIRRGDSYTTLQFGVVGDIPVPGDYDADGKTDIAVFRPSNGGWYLQRSTLGFYGMQWGVAEDKPMPGDYDGDGKTDIAVWRPSNGVWYVNRSTDSVPLYWQFGIATDTPVSGDFDGNGITDFAVYRASQGSWYVLDPQAVPHERTFVWGVSIDVPVPADYDGDGKSDVAIFRPPTGEWYIISSLTGGSVRRIFGGSDDQPTPGSVHAP